MVWLGDGAGGWTPSNTNLPMTGAFFRSLFSHVDHDGNLDIVATMLNQGVKIWTAAEAAPPTINNIQPTAGSRRRKAPPLSANVLDTGSAGSARPSGLYRFSINGGGTWSALLPAGISGSNGSTGTQSIDGGQCALWARLGHAEPASSSAPLTWWAISASAQAIIKIDTTPPTAPTLDHIAPITRSMCGATTTSISIDWGGATDATSGVFGYSVLFDQNPTTLPAADD